MLRATTLRALIRSRLNDDVSVARSIPTGVAVAVAVARSSAATVMPAAPAVCTSLPVSEAEVPPPRVLLATLASAAKLPALVARTVRLAAGAPVLPTAAPEMRAVAVSVAVLSAVPTWPLVTEVARPPSLLASTITVSVAPSALVPVPSKAAVVVRVSAFWPNSAPKSSPSAPVDASTASVRDRSMATMLASPPVAVTLAPPATVAEVVCSRDRFSAPATPVVASRSSCTSVSARIWTLPPWIATPEPLTATDAATEPA